MRFDIMAVILGLISVCMSIVTLMSFLTYSSEVAALKLKIREQDERMEEWHTRLIERTEKALSVVQGCTIGNKRVLEHANHVIDLNDELIRDCKELKEAIFKQNEMVTELRDSCQKLFLLYSNIANENENEKEEKAV